MNAWSPQRPDRLGLIASTRTSRTKIRDDKDIDLARFPFKELAPNEVWLEIVTLAHDRIAWTQALVLEDTWPWAAELVAAFEKLKALPARAG